MPHSELICHMWPGRKFDLSGVSSDADVPSLHGLEKIFVDVFIIHDAVVSCKISQLKHAFCATRILQCQGLAHTFAEQKSFS